MAQLLALDYGGNEARLVVAASRGGRVVIEQAFSVPLGSGQPGEDGGEVDVGRRIAAALADRGIGRIDALVAVPRTSIELRQLSLPQAPDEELPELVGFQAMRQFNELDEDWLLDFVPIDLPAEGHRAVLAAAIGPQLVDQVRQTCEGANLKLQRLILRPCAAASLLGRSRAVEPSQLGLLVDLLSDEVDLTVMLDRKVIYMRTTRLGGDPLTQADQAQALLAEIRRTMAAAQNQFGGRAVESIVLCGSGEQHAALAKLIEEELATPTESFDPFAGLDLGHQLRRALPDHPGRFAALLGMLLAELEQTGHAIDFLHPRRRAAPPSPRRKLVIAGVAAAVLVFAFFGLRGVQRTLLRRRIRNLENSSKELDKEVVAAQKAVIAVNAIQRWKASDIVWLDELRQLSEDFPPAKQAMLTQLTCGRSSRGGKMTLEGLADSASSISSLEDGLRDESHRVTGEGSSDDDSRRYYSRRFTTLVFVDTEQQ